MYDAAMWPFERAAVGAWRRRLAGAAVGRVLEIGAGTGSQLRWYAPGVEVTALEPDAAMFARARRRAAQSVANVTLVEGQAEELPFAGASFDTAVSAFALCTVADPAAALSELRRVLVPGGTLLLLEHVHFAWEPGRSLQTRAAPAWAAVAGGCRLDRDTRELRARGRIHGPPGARARRRMDPGSAAAQPHRVARCRPTCLTTSPNEQRGVSTRPPIRSPSVSPHHLLRRSHVGIARPGRGTPPSAQAQPLPPGEITSKGRCESMQGPDRDPRDTHRRHRPRHRRHATEGGGGHHPQG